MKILIYIVSIIICIAFNSNYLLCQRPLTQIEGLVEIYDNLDSTSLYMGNGAGHATPENQLLRFRDNVFIGSNAGLNNTGSNNSFIGSQSGMHNTYRDENTFLGAYSGTFNDASSNSFIGYKSGYLNTTGSYNCFFGAESGPVNTTGNYNSLIGYKAGFNNISGSYNVFLGVNSGRDNTTGYHNIFLGGWAGSGNSTGNYNTMVGNATGSNSTTGKENSFFGAIAGDSNGSGSQNSYFGAESGSSLADGTQNTMIGFQAGYSIATGNKNIIIGNEAGPTVSMPVSQKLYIDIEESDQPLIYGEFDNDLIRINGDLEVTGLLITPVFDSTSIYLPDMTPDSVDQSLALSNVAIGSMAAHAVTNGSANISIGQSAGSSNSSGNANVYLGHKAGQHMTTANNNVVIGFLAGENVDGSGNIFLGNKSAQQTSPTPLNNRLYISNGPDALIYGEFDNKIARINGELQVVEDDIVIRNIGATEDNTGVKWSENTNPVFGLVYDGEGIGVENRLHLREYLESNLDIMTYKVNGNVGIGVDDPQQNLDVLGNIRIRTVGTSAATNDIRIDALGNLTTSMSDIRLKENLAILPDALERISKIRGVSFTWKSSPNAGTQHGIIAQDVLKVAPELVFEKEGHLGVDYSEMIGLLVESLKELKIENENLRSRIDRIEKR